MRESIRSLAGDRNPGASQPKARAWFPWLLFAPAISLLVCLTIFPLLFSLGISLTRWQLGAAPSFAGLSNYGEFLRDPRFWFALRNTLIIVAGAVPIELLLGLVIAALFRAAPPRWQGLAILLVIPMMLSPLVVGFFWRFLFDQTFGLIGYATEALTGARLAWLTAPRRALAAICIVDIWQWTPFAFLLFLAGLQTVPPELLEAASLERASSWMRFRRIILPHLRFPLLFVLLFRTIDTVRLFDVVYIMTGGGPGDATVTLSVLVHRYGFMFSEMGKAAALSWLIVLVINILALLLIRLLGPARARQAAEGA
jgi:multiple sugar transport system permease protein